MLNAQITQIPHADGGVRVAVTFLLDGRVLATYGSIADDVEKRDAMVEQAREALETLGIEIV